jgi:hypothetical protein
MAIPLLETASIKKALQFAKALAIAAQQDKLSCAHVLLGISLLKKAELGKSGQAGLASASEVLAKIRNYYSFDEKNITPVTSSFPIDDELRKLAMDKDLSDIESFINALTKVVSRTIIPALNQISKFVTAGAARSALIYASQMAEQYKITYIDAELLLVGADAAMKDGKYSDRSDITAHLQANYHNITSLLTERGWNTADLRNVSEERQVLPLAPDVMEAIKAPQEGADLVIAALNVGLNNAARIRLQERIAYHEAGHAVVSLRLRPEVQIEEISLVAKGDADGYVSYKENSPYFSRPTSREDFLSSICVSLAGRASEQKKFGFEGIDAGASSDLETATRLSWKAITQWGLDPEFGPISLSALADISSTPTGWLFDAAQRRLQIIMKEAVETTERTLFVNWNCVEAIVKELKIHKKMNERTLLALVPDLIKFNS